MGVRFLELKPDVRLRSHKDFWFPSVCFSLGKMKAAAGREGSDGSSSLPSPSLRGSRWMLLHNHKGAAWIHVLLQWRWVHSSWDTATASIQGWCVLELIACPLKVRTLLRFAPGAPRRAGLTVWGKPCESCLPLRPPPINLSTLQTEICKSRPSVPCSYFTTHVVRGRLCCALQGCSISG